ncbi:hypothetical protein BABINDRAFT_168373 [Babjeviella inositovora NRRL Y-12698]|uniref:FAR-17a/AIG1-like protein n=1 Tax=Babjeviella inositovora NRRL Y-12698 TaxID=984486 RepID=A0A1E3QKK1_9ASCO|nr:uncharacterized protein BABINDRAFT_168373 [Babjeviella inositovora NRRL Y-12698]ODQ78180.1 hypothetical protein BABINDRAFT_168373 [Babjeviella inositovora NRRL Y-12698]
MMRSAGNTSAFSLSLISIIMGLYGFLQIADTKLHESLHKGGHSQFLTNISLGISMVVFCLGAVAHITKSSTLFTIKNKLHAVALTLESVVAGVYWPFWIFFFHTIADRGPPPPLSLDLIVHLMPVVSLTIDYWLFMPSWKISNSSGFALCVVCTLAYYYWLEHALKLSHFPYPFLNVPTAQRFVTYASIMGVAFVNFVLQKTLFNKFIGSETGQVEVFQWHGKQSN